MKWHTYLATFAIGTVVLCGGAAAADRSSGNLDALLAQINKSSATTLQSAYSGQLRKSVNAAAVQHLEQTCASKHAGSRVQTFTLVGTMRLDGVFKSPTPLPDNAFTSCVADGMASVNFPLPPGSQSGWPVAMQVDGSSGKVLYMAGDRQSAVPRYGRSTSASMPWLYTPMPLIKVNLTKECEVSAWLSVGVQGSIEGVDVAESTCPPVLKKAAVAAMGQWLYVGAPGSHRDASMDLRVSFIVKRKRIRVKL